MTNADDIHSMYSRCNVNAARDVFQLTGSGPYSLQNVHPTYAAADMANMHSPERLSREQLKRLLQWNASPHVTDAMLVQAVYNRLILRRLSLDEIAGA